MPKPRPGESRKNFMNRCIPDLIDEGKKQDQSIAICGDIYDKEATKMVETIAVELELNGAEEVEKQLDELTEKAEKLGDVVEKSMYREEKNGLVYMATSFSQLDEMEEAAERVEDVREMAETFSIISMNIMTDPTIEDKGAALTNLANEFKARVSSETKEKEIEQETLTKELRYKEIEQDESLVKEEDFQGGCKVCGFGDVVKEKCPFCHNEV